MDQATQDEIRRWVELRSQTRAILYGVQTLAFLSRPSSELERFVLRITQEAWSARRDNPIQLPQASVSWRKWAPVAGMFALGCMVHWPATLALFAGCAVGTAVAVWRWPMPPERETLGQKWDREARYYSESLAGLLSMLESSDTDPTDVASRCKLILEYT